MATNKNPFFLNSVNSTPVSFAFSDGTGEKTIFTPAGADGGNVMQINVSSTDTSAVVMQVNVNDGATSRLLGSVSVPTLAGTDGVVPSVNLLNSDFITGLQADGSLPVKNGHTVTVNPVSAVTATFTVDVIPIGGDYGA